MGAKAPEPLKDQEKEQMAKEAGKTEGKLDSAGSHLAPSVFNAVARELAGRKNLLAKLFNNPQRARRMFRMRLLAEDHGDFRQHVLRTVESILNRAARDGAPTNEGDHETT